MSLENSFDKAEAQIRENQRKVDFDVKEFTIEAYVDKYNSGDFFIPEYQREFVWDEKRQAKFIESVVLGLPIPFIFSADVYGREDKDDEDDEGNLEIVDGSQRLRTLSRFVNNIESKTGFVNELKLEGLSVLTELNGLTFGDFSPARKKRFLNSTIRMIMISDKSDADVRFMMFERINTGSDELNSMQKRKGIHQGIFTDFIYECAKNPLFEELTFFTEKMRKREEPQELILRFFAYSENYQNLQYSVIDFLDEYVQEKNKGFDKAHFKSKFQQMLEFVKVAYPNGFLRKEGLQRTPRMRFEALSVGTILALEEKPSLVACPQDWTDNYAFIAEISGNASSSPKRIRSRFEFVKNKLLGQ